MAFEEQITETIEAGAPSIKYQGDIQQQQQIAQQLWEQLPPEARAQFGSFQQFFSSGAWKKVLQALQQQMEQQVPQQGPQQMAQGPQPMAPQPQEGIGSMMPAPMARGGTPEEVISLMEGIRTPRGEEVIDDTMTLASAPSIESEWWDGYQNYLAGGGTLEFEAWKEMTLAGDHRPGEMAQGGITRTTYAMGTEHPVIPSKDGKQLDMRDTGGYQPHGKAEKHDDVRALLAQGEFVMTSDAVKGLGGGDREAGAKKMYDVMHNLEAMA